MSNLAFVGIIAAVLGIGAVVAVPGLMAAKGGHNETGAIVTLRNLGSAQAQFQASGRCDLDGDGIGEFGTFGEMTATDGIRVDPAGATRGAALDRAVLSAALAAVDEIGMVWKSGYAFRIFLPGAKEGAVHEGKATAWPGGGRPKVVKDPAPAALVPGTPFSGPVDLNGTENRWCAYGWPVAHGNSGNRAFFVREEGDVWVTANKDGRYSGVVAGPAWDAAMPADGKQGWSPSPRAAEYRGRDGNLWKRTN